MNRWWIAHVLVLAGLGWIIAARVLTGLYPLSWAGPNIGAGFVTVLAYAAIAVGLGFAVSELGAARGRVATGEQAPGENAPGSPQPARWVPTALVGVAVIGAVWVEVAPPGPGGDGTVGAVGVTVDAAGGPVLVLIVCERSVDTVYLSGPHRGSAPNERPATLTSPGVLSVGTTTLPLEALPAGWDGGPVTLPTAAPPADLVIASAGGDQSRLRQVAFTAADLAGLGPTDMLLDPEGAVPLAEASIRVCR